MLVAFAPLSVYGLASSMFFHQSTPLIRNELSPTFLVTSWGVSLYDVDSGVLFLPPSYVQYSMPGQPLITIFFLPSIH